MRKPMLCLLVMSITVNFPLAACGTPPQVPPTQTAIAVSQPVPSRAPTDARVIGETDATGTLEFQSQGRSISVLAVDHADSRRRLPSIEVSVSETGGGLAVYAEDPSGFYAPVLIPSTESFGETMVVEMTEVTPDAPCVLLSPQRATDNPADYPVLAESLTKDEFLTFFDEVSFDQGVLLFFLPANDPTIPVDARYTIHQGPFDDVFYVTVAGGSAEDPGGWVAVAHAEGIIDEEDLIIIGVSVVVSLGLLALGVPHGAILIIDIGLGLIMHAELTAEDTEQYELPDVRNWEETEAIDLLQDLFTPHVHPVLCRYEKDPPPGTVWDQRPPPGTWVMRDESVTVYVCTRETGVPSVVGMTFNNAQYELFMWVLEGEHVGEEHCQYEPGTVCRQDPLPRTVVPVDTVVYLWTSQGPATATPTPTPTHTTTPTPTHTPTPTPRPPTPTSRPPTPTPRPPTPVPPTGGTLRIGAIEFWKGHWEGDEIEWAYESDSFPPGTEDIFAVFDIHNADHEVLTMRFYHNGEAWIERPFQLEPDYDSAWNWCWPPCVEEGLWELRIFLGSTLLQQGSFTVE